MLKLLFAPAFRVLGRMSFVGGYLFIAFAFLLPLGLALFAPVDRSVLLAGTALLAGLATYLLVGMSLYMSLGIDGLVRLTDRMANGELVTGARRRRHESNRHDSARLWASVMRMSESLGAIVQQVRASSQAIVTGARTLHEGNQQLSGRTQEQAASLEETAAGIEQLASSARQNAENCARATRLADASSEVAAQAASRMQEAVATMREIDDSARRVGEILSTVDGIAFQTNILALNAAIEAARAGHQGRGFAVVAGEVRSLAQRSAEAAREIQSLVGQSNASVQKGRALVTAAEATMAQVTGSVQDVTQVIDEIARASREQSAGVEEISRAIAQVDTAIQQNAALVQESSGTAEAFQREARNLVDVVGRFKTDRGEQRGRAVALVKAAVEHLRKVGAERAYADFNDRNGRFMRGEMYLVVVGTDNCLRAFPPDPSRVGANNANLRDSDGRYFSRDMVELAQRNGSGWYDYRTVNPRSGQVEPKSTYFELVGDVVLQCGIYQGEGAAAQRSAPPQQAPAGVIESSWPRLGTA